MPARPLGRLIAFIMARETWRENQGAIDALEVRETDHVIDIGCGHGRGLGALAARAASGRVVGVDSSDLMTEIAVTRNKALVKAGRVNADHASAADLPFATTPSTRRFACTSSISGGICGPASAK